MSQSVEKNVFTSDKSALKESHSIQETNNSPIESHEVVNPFVSKKYSPTIVEDQISDDKQSANKFSDVKSDKETSLDKNPSINFTEQSSHDNTYMNNASSEMSDEENYEFELNNNIVVHEDTEKAIDKMLEEQHDYNANKVDISKDENGNYTINTPTPFPNQKLHPEIARLNQYKLPLIRSVAVKYASSMTPALRDIYDPESIEDITARNDAIGRIDIYYNSAESFFTYAINRINLYYDENKIEELSDEILKALKKVKDIEELSNSFPISMQLMLGLMLNRLKELCKGKKGKFTNLKEEYYSLASPKSLNNYMNAAKLLELKNIEKYLSCELVIQYKLYMLFKNKLLNIKSQDPILEAFLIVSGKERPDEQDFDRVVPYVVFWKELTQADAKGASFNFNKDEFYKLFKTGYKISKKDFELIIDHGTIKFNHNNNTNKNKELKKSSLKNREITEIDYINKYIGILLENGQNYHSALVKLGIKDPKPKQLTSSDKVENFSVTTTKFLNIMKIYSAKSVVISEQDYANIQEIKKYIEIVENNYKNVL